MPLTPQPPSLLVQTLTKPRYNSEYCSNYTGSKQALVNIRVPTRHRRQAHEETFRPESCRIINPPRVIFPTHLQHYQRPSYAESVRSSSARPASRSPAKEHTITLNTSTLTRPQTHASFLAGQSCWDRPGYIERRPQSKLSGYPKNFRYAHLNTYFHPAQESYRGYFVVDRDWVSERSNHSIRKNNVFA